MSELVIKKKKNKSKVQNIFCIEYISMEPEKNFLNIENIANITDSELYIDDDFIETNGDKNNIDENSLKNISWIDSVEKELSSSIDSKTFTCITPNSEQNPENCQICEDVNTLITIPYDGLKDINIMEYQTIITNNLRKIMKFNTNKSIDIDDVLLKLGWLIDTTKYLSNKIGLVLFNHKETDKNTVARSSYKFCNYNFECEFNYNVKKYSGCFAQHYVHNLVYADISSLHRFIVNNKNDISNKVFEEIKKSINTISFVIGHMYDELKKAETFNFFNVNNIHVERTPKKKKIKHR